MASKEFRKQRKGRNKNTATRGCGLAFGSFGLRALGYCLLTEKQLSASKVAAFRLIKGMCTMHQRVFPVIPVTRKPADVRMGSGKGQPEFNIVRIKPGMLLFEVSGVSQELAAEAFSLAASKLPCPTTMVCSKGMLVVNA